MKQQINKRL